MEAINETTGEVLTMTQARSPTIGKLAEALAKAQGNIRAAAKDSENPHFKSRYADLASIMEVVRVPLAANGLAVIQSPECTATSAGVETLLAHSSGEWISSRLMLPLAQRTAQAAGSALTYARRYSLASMLGVSSDDDDGNAGSGPPRRTPPPPAQNGARTSEATAKAKAAVERMKQPAPVACGFGALKGIPLSEISRAELVKIHAEGSAAAKKAKKSEPWKPALLANLTAIDAEIRTRAVQPARDADEPPPPGDEDAPGEEDVPF